MMVKLRNKKFIGQRLVDSRFQDRNVLLQQPSLYRSDQQRRDVCRDEESCIWQRFHFLACEGLRWICQNQVTLHRGFWRLSRV